MKFSVGKQRPAHYRPAYPEEFELFSHLELCSAVPQALFAITTWKENGLPNLCPHAWTCFHGDRAAFFACMGNLYQHTHTYKNILRDGCFCINFLSLQHYEAMMRAIRENGDDTDEFAAAGLTRERCEEINAPAICESFLTMECRLLDARDLSGAGMAAMVTGEVVRVRVEEGFARGTRDRFGEEGFLLLAPGPQNMESGAPSPTAIGNFAPRLWD